MGTKTAWDLLQARYVPLHLKIEKQIGVHTHVKFLLASFEMDQAVFD